MQDVSVSKTYGACCTKTTRVFLIHCDNNVFNYLSYALKNL